MFMLLRHNKTSCVRFQCSIIFTIRWKDIYECIKPAMLIYVLQNGLHNSCILFADMLACHINCQDTKVSSVSVAITSRFRSAAMLVSMSSN
jgi:hypothetical protein